MSIHYILLGIFTFGVLIFVHELGHFLAAKAFGVGINEFAIGMGPRILSHQGKDGVFYSLRLIPVGGFVSMVGEDGEDSFFDVDDCGECIEHEDLDLEKFFEIKEHKTSPLPQEEPPKKKTPEDALYGKPAWQRFIVFAAGAFMNFVFGLILMGVLVASSEVIYSTEISGFGVRTVTGETCIEDEWSEGLRAGDVIVKVGNRKINVRDDFIYEVMFSGEKPCDVTVIRDGKTVVVPDVEFPTYIDRGLVFGNAAFIRTTALKKTISEVIKQSFCQTASTVKMTWSTLLDTFRGKYGTESISGPVGIVEQVEQTASYGWDTFLYLVVVITINLGIMNLLPLPALDGGRLLFLVIEIVRGKPINRKYEGYVHAVGLVIMLAFIAFVTYNDIMRIFFR